MRTVRLEVVAGPDRGRSLSGAAKATVGTAAGNDLVLTDATVSRYHVEVSRGPDGAVVNDLGSTNGTTIGAVTIRGASAVVRPGAVMSLGDTQLSIGDGEVVDVVAGPDRLGGMLGKSMSMRRVMTSIEQAARIESPILLLGESGTGKELAARAIHELGPRGKQPFVVVDCGAISEQLFTSELFGHERGAFTGADRRVAGAFERAHGGTLFIDEIGELPATLQPALLGALERRRVRRIGGAEEIAIDVRIIAATNRDVRADVNRGAFRLDLYYRLAVVLIELPSLRERSADIALLIEHFARELGHEGPVTEVVPPSRLADLQAYAWPGNVRELRNFVEASLVTGTPPVLAPSSAPPSGDAIDATLGLRYRDARAAVVNEFERRYLQDLLGRTQGNVRKAAREARMDRSYLIELLRRHGMS